MARPRTSELRDQQLLLRLTRNQMNVLESQAFLSHTSAAQLAHQQLASWLAILASDSAVSRLVEIRGDYDASQAVTHSIGDARSRRISEGLVDDAAEPGNSS